MPSLQGLDEVDWHRLRGPYGTSGDVPGALRDLWSHDAGTRANAVGALQENLWHQGTVYEVTAPAVPYLADAALGDVVGRDDRIWLIELLAWIAAGSSYLAVHREYMEEVGEQVNEDDVEQELDWVSAARDAVRRRLPEFLARLDTETDPSIQIALVDLAVQFPEDAGETRPRVSRLAEHEDDDRRRVVLQIALAALGADVDREHLLSRLPGDYYAAEDVEELRTRLAGGEDERAVYRDILDDICGAEITFDNA
jgi:hypothetical protein